MTIETPCTRICKIVGAGGLCRGCGRTLAEIAGWGAKSDGERRDIMAGLADRLRQADIAETSSKPEV